MCYTLDILYTCVILFSLYKYPLSCQIVLSLYSASHCQCNQNSYINSSIIPCIYSFYSTIRVTLKFQNQMVSCTCLCVSYFFHLLILTGVYQHPSPTIITYKIANIIATFVVSPTTWLTIDAVTTNQTNDNQKSIIQQINKNMNQYINDSTNNLLIN